MNKFSRNRERNHLSAQCQNCYRHGHWTYECKNPKVYLVRPSYTAMLKNSKLKPRLNDDEKIPEIPRITDGDYIRDPYLRETHIKNKSSEALLTGKPTKRLKVHSNSKTRTVSPCSESKSDRFTPSRSSDISSSSESTSESSTSSSTSSSNSSSASSSCSNSVDHY